jgi:hypothetical protein
VCEAQGLTLSTERKKGRKEERKGEREGKKNKEKHFYFFVGNLNIHLCIV